MPELFKVVCIPCKALYQCSAFSRLFDCWSVSVHGGHSSAKPGKVGEFRSGLGKVRENEKSQGKLKSVSLYSPTINDTSTDITYVS